MKVIGMRANMKSGIGELKGNQQADQVKQTLGGFGGGVSEGLGGGLGALKGDL